MHWKNSKSLLFFFFKHAIGLFINAWLFETRSEFFYLGLVWGLFWKAWFWHIVLANLLFLIRKPVNGISLAKTERF